MDFGELVFGNEAIDFFTITAADLKQDLETLLQTRSNSGKRLWLIQWDKRLETQGTNFIAGHVSIFDFM